MSYLILKRKTKWALVYRKYSGSTILETRTVALGTFEAEQLGVFPGMSLENAQAALKLNRKDALAQYHANRRARLTERADQREKALGAWLPGELVKAFQRERLPMLGGRKERWLIVKTLLTQIEIPPYEWCWQPEVFWKLFESKGWSLGYVRRHLRFINAWGEFYCRRTGKTWAPVPKPGTDQKAKINRANFKKRGSLATLELTLEQLVRAAAVLPPKQTNALKLAFWCLLRKEELAYVLEKPSSPDTWYLDQDRRGFHVFHLFQEKLERKGTELRLCWKAVPLVEPEQVELVKLIKTGEFQMPSLTKLRELGIRLTNRSARKGASVELEARGYSRACVDDWLGHVGNTTASKSYRSRRLAMWEPPAKWG